MNIKQTGLLATVLFISGSILFAAGTEESSSADRLSAVGFNATGFPIVEQTVTVEVLVPRPPWQEIDTDDMTVLVDLQKKTNVDLVFEEMTSDGAQERTSLMFASRDFPDVIWDTTANNQQIYDAGVGGDIYALGDLIDQYAPNWKQAFTDRPVIKNAITQPDGKIYSLPYYREILNDFGIRDIDAINVDWLDKVGMEIPTTTEELYEVLKAFRKGIDSGLLPKNGVPWYFYFHNWVGGEWELYNAFGLWMKGQGKGARRYLSVNNGTVEFGAIDPKLKTAVNYMHRLYSENLIVEEAFTDSWDDYIAKTRSVPPITGKWGSYFIIDDVEKWFDPAPPVAGPTGVKRFRSQPVRLQTNQFSIATSFDLPEVMIRFIDLFADDDLSVQLSYGGPMIEQNSDGTRTVVGSGRAWRNHGPHNHVASYISKQASDNIRWTGEQGARAQYVQDVYEDFLWPQDRHFAGYVTFNDEETEELAILETEIGDYIKRTIANWIIDGNADQDWDNYLKELDRLGLEEVMKIYQSAYTRFSGN